MVVVGAGGAGLRATLGMAEQGLRTACISKVFPTRSTHGCRTGRHRGIPWRTWGRTSWQWHMYDTVKGSDWLGDTDAMEYLAREAPKAVYELEHYGVPFSVAPKKARFTSGPLVVTPLNSVKVLPVQRTCAAADRTGHAILHTLYGQIPEDSKAEFLHRIFRH